MTNPLRFATIPELRARLDKGETTPTELARLAIDGLETIGRDLNAVAATLPDRAQSDIARLDRRHARSSALTGIPWGAKDLISVKGAPTTWGAPPYRDRTFDTDATIVTRLASAGAPLVAKLSTIELAGGWVYRYPNASLQGATRTPWNINHWAGGSSGGSAAAVAAGLVPFAIGSETSGSIVTPAAFCGVSAIRPTVGLVSRHGVMPLSWTLDKLGPFARTARDAWTVLRTIEGYDPADDSTRGRKHRGLAQLPGTDRLKSVRIGFAQADFDEYAAPPAREAFATALQDLRRLGASWVHASLPAEIPYGAIGSSIGAAEGASAHGDLIESDQFQLLVDAKQKASLLAGREILAHVYIDAQRARRQVIRAFETLFQSCDVIVSVAQADGAPPHNAPLDMVSSASGTNTPGQPNNRAIVPASNLAGLPAVVVPCGFTTSGLPVAIQFVGPAWSEPTLVALGEWFQSQTDWHARRPPQP
ncbi:MAG: amidase [Chloroflexi bacterium]|nr:amidase [Chloroflexota bacterium]